MRRPIRYSFTLMELLVALSLLVLLSTLLFGSFRQVTRLRLRAAKQREASFQHRYARARLGQVFGNAKIEKKNRDWFYLANPDDVSDLPSLVLTFDNGIDLVPAFSGMVLGRVYLDNSKRLCLATWPLSIESPIDYRFRREVLLEDVEELRFAFYHPPSSEDVEVNIGWGSHWRADLQKLPAMVRLEVQGKRGERFSFILPWADFSIKYSS